MNNGFNFDDVFPPQNSVNPEVYVDYLIRKSKKSCGKIDERITAMEAEFNNLIKEYKKELIVAENTTGFWNRWRVTRKVKEIGHRIAINRDLRNTLYMERWKRT